jgi:soluble lytic murein transglycosylase-like protein
MIKFLFIIFLQICLILPVFSSEIYYYKDPKTNITYYTNKPKHAEYKVKNFSSIIIKYQPSYKPSYINKKYKNYQDLIQNVADLTQLEAALLHAIAQAESSYNPNAISSKGAVGLMQLMPATAQRFGVSDRSNVNANLYGAARYLRYLLKLFNNNKKLAIAAYNAGENAVKRYGNQIPPYKETRNYVAKVMKLYKTYQRIL